MELAPLKERAKLPWTASFLPSQPETTHVFFSTYPTQKSTLYYLHGAMQVPQGPHPGATSMYPPDYQIVVSAYSTEALTHHIESRLQISY